MTALLERRALEIWQERERQFPAFVRRMRPDRWDMASGAWQRVVDQALRDMESTQPKDERDGSGSPSYGRVASHSSPAKPEPSRMEAAE